MYMHILRTLGANLTRKWIFVCNNFLSTAELCARHHTDVLWCSVFGTNRNTDRVVNRRPSVAMASMYVLTPSTIAVPDPSVQVIYSNKIDENLGQVMSSMVRFNQIKSADSFHHRSSC